MTRVLTNILDSRSTNLLSNVFCPTGEGGGIDPTCGKGGGKGAARATGSLRWAKTSSFQAREQLRRKYNAEVVGATHDQATKIGRNLGMVKARVSPEVQEFMESNEVKFVVDNKSTAGVSSSGVYDINDASVHLSGLDESATKIVDTSGSAFVVDSTAAGTIRHEYGHYVHDKFIGFEDREWRRLYDKYKNDDTAVSVYGRSDHMEMFAESFSALTNVGYGKGLSGRLPEDIEGYMRSRLGLGGSS
jgi:hypothetical protein